MYTSVHCKLYTVVTIYVLSINWTKGLIIEFKNIGFIRLIIYNSL